MYNGDPKRPKNIILYEYKPPGEESDLFLLMSMVFGIMSFMLKVRVILKFIRLNGESG
jgi:hypothetical protein